MYLIFQHYNTLVKNEEDLIRQIDLNLNNPSQEKFNNIIDAHGVEIFNNTLDKVSKFIKNEIK